MSASLYHFKGVDDLARGQPMPFDLIGAAEGAKFVKFATHLDRRAINWRETFKRRGLKLDDYGPCQLGDTSYVFQRRAPQSAAAEPTQLQFMRKPFKDPEPSPVLSTYAYQELTVHFEQVGHFKSEVNLDPVTPAVARGWLFDISELQALYARSPPAAQRQISRHFLESWDPERSVCRVIRPWG